MNDHKNTLRFATTSGNSLKKVESGVVYHLHQKPIWFQTVQMERNNFDWKIPFGARAFHFP